MRIKAITGGVNTDEQTVLAHVRHAIRLGLPQVRPYREQGVPIALVAGGPSLLSTQDELRDDVFRGCQVVTVNGAYHWCLDHNIKPSMAIMLDARPENAEFFARPVHGCKYLMASQCAPEAFEVVKGRDVHLFHALSYEEPEVRELTAYYGEKRFCPVEGGSTVTVRALSLLRMLGFLRIDVYGFDSCWYGFLHHAYPQVLNDVDKRINVTVSANGIEDRAFVCAPWHLKQWEDFQQFVRVRGNLLALHVHGDGLIAYMMKRGARLIREDQDESRRRADSEDAGVSREADPVGAAAH